MLSHRNTCRKFVVDEHEAKIKMRYGVAHREGSFTSLFLNRTWISEVIEIALQDDPSLEVFSLSMCRSLMSGFFLAEHTKRKDPLRSFLWILPAKIWRTSRQGSLVIWNFAPSSVPQWLHRGFPTTAPRSSCLVHMVHTWIQRTVSSASRRRASKGCRYRIGSATICPTWDRSLDTRHSSLFGVCPPSQSRQSSGTGNSLFLISDEIL